MHNKCISCILRNIALLHTCFIFHYLQVCFVLLLCNMSFDGFIMFLFNPVTQILYPTPYIRQYRHVHEVIVMEYNL